MFKYGGVTVKVAGSKKLFAGGLHGGIIGSCGKENASNTPAPPSECKCGGRTACVEGVGWKENVLKSWKYNIASQNGVSANAMKINSQKRDLRQGVTR